MSSPGWTLAAIASADSYDTVRVTEIHMRFPVDASIGGFMVAKRMRNGQDVAEHRVVLVDTDMASLPPALMQSFLAWAQTILAARSLLTPGATQTTITAAAPPPTAAPTLGPVL